MNITTQLINGTDSQLTGVSYTTKNLTLTGLSTPVSADNFLRSDQPGTINGYLLVNNDAGIRIGKSAQTVWLEKRVTGKAILSNRLNASAIGISVVKDNILNEIISVDGNNLRVGINNISPTAALDVTGSAKISGTLLVSQSVNLSATLAVGAGASVVGSFAVGGQSMFSQKVVVGTMSSFGTAIEPVEGSNWDLGSVDKPFRNVYANSFGTTSTNLSFVTSGMITAFAGVGALPDGWLLCDGAAFSAIQYPRLASILGNPSTPNISGFGSIRYIIKY
jgi:hypothetical protein